MNDIIFAGKYEKFETSKNFEIIIPDNSDKITVIPPRTENGVTADGTRVTLDMALLPFRKVTEVCDDGSIKRTAEQAVCFYNSDLPKKELILSALGELLTAFITAFSAHSEFSPVVNMVIEDIKKGVSDSTYKIKDSLKKLPLNYDYTRKVFLKETGISPHGYLIQQRMKLARELILSGISNQYSKYTVSQVAEACGYSDPLYFSQAFKKYFGVSPSEYK